MVQRSGGPYSPDRVKVNEKTPKVEGAANWARKGADTIDVNGPEVSLTAPTVIEAATADEWGEMNVGPRIQVGPTQSVTASMRTGVYREGATGPVSGTYNMKAGPSRDAQWDRQKRRSCSTSQQRRRPRSTSRSRSTVACGATKASARSRRQTLPMTAQPPRGASAVPM